MTLKQYDIFFKNRRRNARSFNAHNIKDLLVSLSILGIKKKDIKQIQSERKIIKL